MSRHPTAGAFLRARRYGVLATQSRSLPGYPFGSITPYVLGAAGEPVIYISTLAEHTRNIADDPRVSLTVFDPADAADPQAPMAHRVSVVPRAQGFLVGSAHVGRKCSPVGPDFAPAFARGPPA